MTRAQLLAVDVIRAAAIGIVAAVASVAVAFAISPLTPIGVARELEPSPGFAFDVAAIVVGAAAVAVALVLVGAFTSRRAPEVQPRRTGSAADTLARWRLPLTTISGVRLALAQGPRTSSVPTAATVLSATVAVAVVAVALTFTASLQHLFSTPRLYGQNWDYRTNYDVPRLARTAPTRRSATLLRETRRPFCVNGRRVTVSAMDDVKGRIGPVVTAGQAAGEDRRARSLAEHPHRAAPRRRRHGRGAAGSVRRGCGSSGVSCCRRACATARGHAAP